MILQASRLLAFLLPLLLSSTALAFANEDPGSSVIDMRVLDIDGELHRLGAEQGYRPVVLVMLDSRCPIATRYAPDLNEVAILAASEGLEFYGVLSAPEETVASARAFREECTIRYPLLFDSNGDLAMRLRPTHVPEAFVVGKDDSVLYRGRIDNRYVSVGRLRQQITVHDLAAAIRAVASGKAVENPRTDPVGCVFEAWSDELPEPVTYNQHVQPILSAHCIDCHVEGGSGPFPLDDYASAARRAGMVSLVTGEGIMPPWHAERDFRRFRDDRKMSARQLALLDKWAREGKAEGDAKFKLPRREINLGWSLGTPDAVVTMEQAYELPASGPDQYRRFVMKSPFDEPAEIVAIDFLPGDPQVVHHVNLFFDETGEARKRDAADPGPGYDAFGGKKLSQAYDWETEGEGIGGWAPGSGAYELPPGVGMWLPARGDIMIEVHYHLSGRKTADQSSVGFYLAKKPTRQSASGFLMGSVDVDIPAGDADYLRKIYFDVPVDMKLIDLSPHMHYVGTECRAEAVTPDGEVIPLIHIPDWDFRWQGFYAYREPIHIPKGSRITAWFRYDNSAGNPDNPTHPPKRVGWGWQSSDEMLEIWGTMIETSPQDAARIQTAAFETFYRGAKPD